MPDQKSRYITLLGDPIHQYPVTSFVTAPDFKAGGLSAAFLAVAEKLTGLNPDEITANIAECLEHNIIDSILFRFFFEKIFLKWMTPNNPGIFIQQETLRSLCIDTQPEPEAIINSLITHNFGIRSTRFFYGGFGILTMAMKGLNLLNIAYLAQNASELTRVYNGFHRFNKLARGEWAIVTTPPKEVRKPVEETSTEQHYVPA